MLIKLVVSSFIKIILVSFVECETICRYYEINNNDEFFSKIK